MTTYYELMEIANDASRNEIKRAYFTLVKKYPPEKEPEKFKQIRKAYETLYNNDERAVYDGMISLPEEYREIYTRGFELIESGNYDDDIAGKLKKAVAERPDMCALSDVLGQIYLNGDKSGNALKIYSQLTSQQPQNLNYRMKLAEAYLKRGFHKKALTEYQNLIAENGDHAVFWAGICNAYVVAGDIDAAWRVLSEGFSVVEKNGGDPIELNVVAIRLSLLGEGNYDELQRQIEILSERANNDPAAKSIILSKFGNVASFDQFAPTTKTADGNTILIKCALLMSKFILKLRPNEEFEEFVKMLSITEVLSRLESDKKVPKFILAITEIKTIGETSAELKVALAMWEAECLVNTEMSRKQLKYVRENYPEQYELNRAFYDRVLDYRQERRLISEVRSKINVLRKKYPEEFLPFSGGDDENYDNENDMYDDWVHTEPFKRNAPKVGRNDPCPCGSGKKYKKCCGA